MAVHTYYIRITTLCLSYDLLAIGFDDRRLIVRVLLLVSSWEKYIHKEKRERERDDKLIDNPLHNLKIAYDR